MKCIGYGQFKGKCENIAGTPWTAKWCLRCDEIRRDTITKKFENMLSEMKGQAAITAQEGEETDVRD